jgi:hypothetical protein
MIAALQNVFGPSAANWLMVAAAGLVFLAAASLLPSLLRRCRGRNGPLL